MGVQRTGRPAGGEAPVFRPIVEELIVRRCAEFRLYALGNMRLGFPWHTS